MSVGVVRAAGGLWCAPTAPGSIRVRRGAPAAVRRLVLPQGQGRRRRGRRGHGPARGRRRRPACGAELDAELPTIRYLDHLGRPKVVRYWVMHPAGRGLRAGRRGRRAPLDHVRRAEAAADLRPRPGADPGAPSAVAARAAGVPRAAREGRRPGAVDRGRPAPPAHEEGPPPGGRARRRASATACVERIVTSPYVRCVQTRAPARPRAPGRARDRRGARRGRRPSPPRSTCSRAWPTRRRCCAATAT